MKVEVKTVVKLTPEEAIAIQKARDILCNYEMNSQAEQDTALEDWFENEMDYNLNYGALPVATDFLTFLLRASGYEEEE